MFDFGCGLVVNSVVSFLIFVIVGVIVFLLFKLLSWFGFSYIALGFVDLFYLFGLGFDYLTVCG